MGKTTIALKNIALPTKTVVLRDLNDCSIAIASTELVSDTNAYSKIKWSTDLFDAITDEELVVVIDGVEYSKEGSLSYLKDSSGVANNEGQVKINTGNLLKPSQTWGGGGNPAAGVQVKMNYVTPLAYAASPTTEWPQNIPTPVDADIYDFVNDTFIENKIPGQVNNWRVIFNFSGKPNGVTTGIIVTLENPLSGFQATQLVHLPSETTSGVFSVLLTTIADAASLPAPLGVGQGYELLLNPDDPITLELDSITRVNNQKNIR